jgi:[ribosomal protein S5]-alanine N-acetyltransferase
MRDIITSARLTLRPFTLADVPAVCALLGNYDVVKMISRAPHPYSEADGISWISTHAKGRAAGTDYPYAITLGEDGTLIGAIGLHITTRLQDIAPGSFEVGYWLGEPYWGHGYATEAGIALIAAYDEDLGPAPIISGHFTENPQSGHVLEKLGFHYVGEPTTIFCVARQEDVPDRSMLRPASTATSNPNPIPERSPTP